MKTYANKQDLAPLFEQFAESFVNKFGDKFKQEGKKLISWHSKYGTFYCGKNSYMGISVVMKAHNSSNVLSYERYHGRVHLILYGEQVTWTSVVDGKDYSDFLSKVETQLKRYEAIEKSKEKSTNLKEIAEQALEDVGIEGRNEGARATTTIKEKKEIPSINFQKNYHLNSDDEFYRGKLNDLFELLKFSDKVKISINAHFNVDDVQELKNYLDKMD